MGPSYARMHQENMMRWRSSATSTTVIASASASTAIVGSTIIGVGAEAVTQAFLPGNQRTHVQDWRIPYQFQYLGQIWYTTGEIKNNMPDGNGIRVCSSGSRFSGIFQAGKPYSGEADKLEFSQSDNTFTGHLQCGKFHGICKIEYSNGDVFKAEFNNGIMIRRISWYTVLTGHTDYQLDN